VKSRSGAKASIVALGALALGGCAAQADIAALRAEQRLLARRLADTRADVQAVKGDVARLRGQLDDMGYRRRYTPPAPPPARYDDMSGMQGDPSGAPSGMPPGDPTMDPSQQSPYGDPSRPPPPPPPMDPRYGAVEPPPMEPAAPAPANPPSVDLNADYSKGQDPDYRQGLESYQRADYGRAVQSLRRFVGKNPTAEAVPTAQYWIGESYYSQGKYNEAILAYNEILVAWPKDQRVPAALLRQATAFANLGDKIDARLILQKLISDHPGTQEAEQAKGQLRALGA
jgi:tol-pal system protein YbgF